ncbi:MAG: GNAT family N-acetyltransferase [Anaerolineales bacterium]|nr:GNAT family N-acetyltransferase [Anaerolineales bacterium]
MDADFTIRVAVVQDISELDRLNRVFNGCDENVEELVRRFEDPRRIEWPVVAEVDGRLVGFAALRLAPGLFYPEPHAEMTELYVEDAYRRRGIGRELVQYVERLAVEMGAVELWLMTGKENLPAQDFYRALGYEQDDLVMSKELKKE